MDALQSLALPPVLRGIVSRYFLQYKLVLNQALPDVKPVGILYKLPNEIIHYILDIAVQSSPASGRALCRVSTWARECALQYAFSTITIFSKDDVCWFFSYPTPSNTYSHNGPWKRPTHYTRNLWIDSTVLSYKYPDRWDPLTIVEYCPNAVNLALSEEGIPYLHDYWKGQATIGPNIYLTILGGLSERDDPPSINDEPSQQLQFPRLTHLNLMGIRDPLDLARYPNLTHVAFWYHLDTLDYLKFILRQIQVIKSVRMIVITSTCSHTYTSKTLTTVVREIRSIDKRVYLLKIPREGSEEWKRSSNNITGNIWEEAVKYSKNNGIL